MISTIEIGGRKYITVREAARRKGVVPQSVRYLVKRGIVPGIRAGRDFLIEEEAWTRYRPSKPTGAKSPCSAAFYCTKDKDRVK